MSVLEMQEARQIAGLELNALRFLEALPASDLLFYRFPVAKRGARPGYADVAGFPTAAA